MELEETQKKEFGRFKYFEQLDAYCHINTDTMNLGYEILDGRLLEDGSIELYWKVAVPSFAEGEGIVKMVKKEERWLFYSNRMTEKSGDPGQIDSDNTLPAAGSDFTAQE